MLASVLAGSRGTAALYCSSASSAALDLSPPCHKQAIGVSLAHEMQANSKGAPEKLHTAVLQIKGLSVGFMGMLPWRSSKMTSA